MKNTHRKIDCNSDEGKAIGLIDAIISICKELSNYTHKHTAAMKEAIKDLQWHVRSHELDSFFLAPLTEKEIENRKFISRIAENIRKTILIEDKNGWISVGKKLPEVGEIVDGWTGISRMVNIKLTNQNRWERRDAPKRMRDTGRLIGHVTSFEFKAISHWGVPPDHPENGDALIPSSKEKEQ